MDGRTTGEQEKVHHDVGSRTALYAEIYGRNGSIKVQTTNQQPHERGSGAELRATTT